MASAEDLRTVLNDIRRRLLERHAFVFGDGVLVDDPEYDKEQQIFEDLQARLSIAIKNYQKGKAGKGGKQPTNEDDLLKLARELQIELRELASKNQRINLFEGAAELWDHAHEYHEQLDKLRVEIGAGRKGEIVAPEGGSYIQTAEAAALWVFVLIQAYRLHLKRKGKK
jgi:hypothetical protein